MGLHTQRNKQGSRGQFHKLLIRKSGEEILIVSELLVEFRWQACAGMLLVKPSANRHKHCTLHANSLANRRKVLSLVCVWKIIQWNFDHSQHIISRKVSFVTTMTHFKYAAFGKRKPLQETQGSHDQTLGSNLMDRLWQSFLNAFPFWMQPAMRPLWMCYSVWQGFDSFQCTH